MHDGAPEPECRAGPMTKTTVLRSFLSPLELDVYRELARHSIERYTTRRGTYRMAELAIVPFCESWLDGAEPYSPYLIYYGTGAGKEEHCDPGFRAGQVHERLVCLIQECLTGGELIIDGQTIDLKAGDAVTFRADTTPHAVSKVMLGERIVLTIGKLRD